MADQDRWEELRALIEDKYNLQEALLKGLEGKVGTVENKVNDLKDDTTRIFHALSEYIETAHRYSKVTSERVDQVGKRIDLLSERLDILSKRIDLLGK